MEEDSSEELKKFQQLADELDKLQSMKEILGNRMNNLKKE
jgi:hypothetical protein